MGEVARLDDGDTLRIRFWKEGDLYATVKLAYDSERGIQVSEVKQPRSALQHARRGALSELGFKKRNKALKRGQMDGMRQPRECGLKVERD